MTGIDEPTLEAQLAVRRARVSKVEAADIERTRERMLAVAKRLGVVPEDATVADILARPMPMPNVVIEAWAPPVDPRDAEDMTDGEAFLEWASNESSHADLRRRAANDGGEL